MRLREAKLLPQGHTARERRSPGIAPTSAEIQLGGEAQSLSWDFCLFWLAMKVVFLELTL